MCSDPCYHSYVVKYILDGKDKGETVVVLPPLTGVWLPFLKQGLAKKLGEQMAPGLNSYQWLESKISVQLQWGDSKPIFIRDEDKYDLTPEQFHRSMKSLKTYNLGLVVAVIDSFTIPEDPGFAAVHTPAPDGRTLPRPAPRRDRHPSPPHSDQVKERTPQFCEFYLENFLTENLRLYKCLGHDEVVVPRGLRIKIQALFNHTLAEVGKMSKYLDSSTKAGLRTRATAILDSAKLKDMERKQARCFVQIHLNNKVMPIGFDRDPRNVTKKVRFE